MTDIEDLAWEAVGKTEDLGDEIGDTLSDELGTEVVVESVETNPMSSDVVAIDVAFPEITEQLGGSAEGLDVLKGGVGTTLFLPGDDE